MKKIILVLLLMVTNVTLAQEQVNCEKVIEVELSQSRFSLDIWEHAKDAMNAVKFKLPVSCKFYNEIKVGDNLLKDKFRTGSLVINGSIGNWNLKVVKK